MQRYNPSIQQLFMSPENVGSLDEKSRHVGTGLAGIAGRSNVARIQLLLNESKKIVDAKFKTHGCGVAIAASSWVTSYLRGKKLSDAAKLSNQDIIKALDISQVKYQCAYLVEDALQLAISDYEQKQARQES